MAFTSSWMVSTAASVISSWESILAIIHSWWASNFYGGYQMFHHLFHFFPFLLYGGISVQCSFQSNLYWHQLSCVFVTIDGVWTGEWFYWPLIHASRNHKPLLMSAIHKSPEHPLILFLACCVFISRSLAMVSNSGDSSASHTQVLSLLPSIQNSLHSLPCRTHCQLLLSLACNISARTT
jgi:hypothetical protein